MSVDRYQRASKRKLDTSVPDDEGPGPSSEVSFEAEDAAFSLLDLSFSSKRSKKTKIQGILYCRYTFFCIVTFYSTLCRI